MESLSKTNEIGNVIEEVVNLYRQIHLEVDTDDVQKLLKSTNQEQIVELIKKQVKAR